VFGGQYRPAVTRFSFETRTGEARAAVNGNGCVGEYTRLETSHWEPERSHSENRFSPDSIQNVHPSEISPSPATARRIFFPVLDESTIRAREAYRNPKDRDGPPGNALVFARCGVTATTELREQVCARRSRHTANTMAFPGSFTIFGITICSAPGLVDKKSSDGKRFLALARWGNRDGCNLDESRVNLFSE